MFGYAGPDVRTAADLLCDEAPPCSPAVWQNYQLADSAAEPAVPRPIPLLTHLLTCGEFTADDAAGWYGVLPAAVRKTISNHRGLFVRLRAVAGTHDRVQPSGGRVAAIWRARRPDERA